MGMLVVPAWIALQERGNGGHKAAQSDADRHGQKDP